MATNTNPFYTYSATAGSSKTLQKPQDGGDNNQWGNYINTDLDEIVSAVNALSDKIADANENTLVDFTATGSAVNHVGITNAAAGSGPTISTAGTDSNVDLNVTPKGTGDSVFTNKIKVDDVIEKTTDHGVEIEGVTLKDGGGTFSGDVSFGVNNITNVSNIALDEISARTGTSITVSLGTDAGDDFNVGSGKLVVEGDTGKVGIGTSSPNSRLTLSDGDKIFVPTGEVLNFGHTDGSTNTERMRIDSSGKVGIGTNSAQSFLQVNGTGSGGAGEVSITRVDTSQTLVNGSGLGYLYFGGQDGDSGLDKNAAEIIAHCEETWTSSAHGSRLGFSTTAIGSTTATERMRIDSSGNLAFNSGFGSVGTAYGCRAWVNFNGSLATIAIRASGNVSSITDNGGNGDYTVNFTTAMPDADYSVLALAGVRNSITAQIRIYDSPAPSTTSVRFEVAESSTGSLSDTPQFNFAIFR